MIEWVIGDENGFSSCVFVRHKKNYSNANEFMKLIESKLEWTKTDNNGSRRTFKFEIIINWWIDSQSTAYEMSLKYESHVSAVRYTLDMSSPSGSYWYMYVHARDKSAIKRGIKTEWEKFLKFHWEQITGNRCWLVGSGVSISIPIRRRKKNWKEMANGSHLMLLLRFIRGLCAYIVSLVIILWAPRAGEPSVDSTSDSRLLAVLLCFSHIVYPP